MSAAFSDNALPLDALLAQFQDATLEPGYRVKAVNQLVERADQPQVIHALVSCVKNDTEITLLTHTIGMLGRKKLYSAVEVLLGLLACTNATKIEKQHGGKTFRQTDAGLRIRVAVIQALGRMEDQRAVDPLIALLSDMSENYRVRLAAAEALGRLGDQQALSPLVNIVQNDFESSQYLKESAVKALGMLGDIRALDPLLDMFESKKGWLNKFSFVKEQVIEAIGKIGHTNNRVQENLIRSLSDRAGYIRLASVESLGEVGDVASVPHLMSCLQDKDDDVAIAAVHSLFQIGGLDLIKSILATQSNLRELVREELEAYVP